MICNKFFSRESLALLPGNNLDALIKEFISNNLELVVVEIESSFLNFPIVLKIGRSA